MGQRQHGAVGDRVELDRDQRFTLRRALPRPREGELAVGHDLAIEPAHAVMLVLGIPELHLEAATDAQVGLGDPPAGGGGRGRLRTAGTRANSNHTASIYTLSLHDPLPTAL